MVVVVALIIGYLKKIFKTRGRHPPIILKTLKRRLFFIFVWNRSLTNGWKNGHTERQIDGQIDNHTGEIWWTVSTSWQHWATLGHVVDVANALPMFRQHVTNALPTFCQRVANVLPTRCQCVANILPMCCQRVNKPLSMRFQRVSICGKRVAKHIANALLTHCQRVANMLPTRCQCVVHALPTRCPRVAHALPTRCQCIANALPTCYLWFPRTI